MSFVLGCVGGSGIYQIDGLEEMTWQHVDTPFGAPSDDYLVGKYEGLKVVFLPRHGRGHKVSPSDINYRANICGFKMLGVTHILSLSAVGSLKEEHAPGDFVLIDQFIDRTFARVKSFFEPGLVGHISMANPVCPVLIDAVHAAATGAGIPIK